MCERLSDRDMIVLCYMAAGWINVAPGAAERQREARLQAMALCEPVPCDDGTPHPTWTQATKLGCEVVAALQLRLVILRWAGVWRVMMTRPMTARQAERAANNTLMLIGKAGGARSIARNACLVYGEHGLTIDMGEAFDQGELFDGRKDRGDSSGSDGDE